MGLLCLERAFSFLIKQGGEEAEGWIKLYLGGMENGKVTIPPENVLPVVVNMLADILAWQTVEQDLAAQQMAMAINRPLEECQAALDKKTLEYRRQIVEKLYQDYSRKSHQ